MAGTRGARARAHGAHTALFKEKQQETASEPPSAVLPPRASQWALQKCASLPGGLKTPPMKGREAASCELSSSAFRSCNMSDLQTQGRIQGTGQS